jgi:TetR/AcrR family transcriptional repressor of lmrAB and yxaGH operons
VSTAKGERSRARLVGATAALLQRQGYHATGLGQIVQESGAPRGSLYFYFPGGKEELACTALAESGEAMRQQLEAVVAAAPDPAAAVEDVCRVVGENLAGSGYAHGCPLATVALEAAADSDAVREVCATHYARWEHSIAARLVAAGAAPERAAELATFVLATIEGALLLAKVKRDRGPLEQAGRLLAGMMRRMLDSTPAPGPAGAGE